MRQPGLIEPPTLALHEGAAGVPVDVARMVFSRLLVMAGSGAGKGWMIRYILEETRETLPQLVIDWEGEFVNLRDIHPYVVIGDVADGADVQIALSTARLYCRRLMSVKASVVVDLTALRELAERQEYAALFLDELIELPKEHRHLRLVVIDEAHQLCPEGKDVPSSAAVKALVSRGRKRGLGAILSTQRFAKLSKDATECQARLAGRSTQDVDTKRVADELGLTKGQAQELAELPDGHFFASGRAFGTGGLQIVRAGATQTRPEEISTSFGVPTPKAIASALKGLEAAAEHLAEDAGRQELVEEVERLQAQIKSLKEGNLSDPADIARAVASAVAPLNVRIEKLELYSERVRNHARAILLDNDELPPETAARLNDLAERPVEAVEILNAQALPPKQAAMLEWMRGRGDVERAAVAIGTGQSPTSGDVRTNFAALIRLGLVEIAGKGQVRIAEARSE